MEAIKRIISTGGQAQASQYNAEEIKVRQYNKQQSYAGSFVSYDVHIYHDCKLCGNKRKIAYINDEGKFDLKRCECVDVIRMKGMLAKSGMTELAEKYTFDKYTTGEPWQENIKNAAKSFVADAGKNWFFMGGQVGCGKSHICTAIVIELIKQGKEAEFIKWHDESVDLKQNITDFEAYAKRINKLKTVPVLYIDDFFKSAPTAADKRLAFEIIDYRYNSENLITIVSSELQIRDIIAQDEAAGSRIYERSKKYQININPDINKNFRLR